MYAMSSNDFIMTMALVLLVIGVVVLGIGVFTLIKKVLGKELDTIADQTVKIAQKGITDEISGLVGNARALAQMMPSARLVVVSHLGRPKGKPAPKMSLAPAAKRLAAAPARDPPNQTSLPPGDQARL